MAIATTGISITATSGNQAKRHSGYFRSTTVNTATRKAIRTQSAAQKLACLRWGRYCLQIIHIRIPVPTQKPNHLVGITIPVRTETKAMPMSTREVVAIPKRFSASKAKVIRRDARLGFGVFIQECGRPNLYPAITNHTAATPIKSQKTIMRSEITLMTK
jgi:hypothetical protein